MRYISITAHKRTMRPSKTEVETPLNRAMGWFLTWPKCDLSPQEALEILQVKATTPIKEYVVAREKHKDGTLHLHAFIRYEKKVCWSATRWDLGPGIHGQYEKAKSWVATQRYCKKDGDFIANIDTESALQKKGKKNMQILTGDLKDLLESGELNALSLPNAIKARAAFCLLDPPADQKATRGVWIWGAPGCGKSHSVRSKYPQADLFLKAQNKWWDGYQGQKAVLLDDFDKLGSCLSHYLKIWADKWSCTGEIKGGTIPLNYEKLYITSNYEPKEIFTDDLELLQAIERRFKIIHMGNAYDILLGKRTPN